MQFQRWTAKRKVELLLKLIRGQKNLVHLCRDFDLNRLETFLKAGEQG